MNINNISNYNLSNNDFTSLSTPPSDRKVKIKWNNQEVHTITGPTPFVDISNTFEEDGAGIPSYILENITLSGKIVKQSGVGFTYVMSGISGLKSLFSGCSISNLEIFCDNALLFNASGVKVKDISFSKTEDNWVKSADYTISLENKRPIRDTDDNWVEDKAESWSIEPLDEIVYTKLSKNVIGKPELYNPGLGKTPTAIGGGLFGNSSLQISVVPQFRITRRLSAKGIPKPSPTGSGCSTNSKDILQSSVLNAKKWVDSQSFSIFNGNGTITIPGSGSASPTWLYNHTRTTSTDLYNSSYEVNDSWLAMPTGTAYIETFNIDASTDAENIKTVRVAGNIQGLVIMPQGLISSTSGILTSGTSSPTSTNASGLKIDLSNSLVSGISQGGLQSTSTSTQGAKYINALQAWTGDIKPYLYRRACFAMRSEDRIYDPINSLLPSAVPPNPIFTKEGLLNVNPVSTSEGHDPVKGTISYSYEYNNKLQILSGVLSENIRISNTAPADNIQEIQIIGRALGPLLFSAGRSNPRKSISVDITVPKPTGIKGMLMTDPSCPVYYSGFLWTSVNTLINGIEPFANKTTPFFDNATSQQFGTVFKDSDSEDWNPTDGRYSRTVSWVYQQCTTDRFYFDH